MGAGGAMREQIAVPVEIISYSLGYYLVRLGVGVVVGVAVYPIFRVKYSVEGNVFGGVCRGKQMPVTAVIFESGRRHEDKGTAEGV